MGKKMHEKTDRFFGLVWKGVPYDAYPAVESTIVQLEIWAHKFANLFEPSDWK